jgi:23S rRNA (adenine2503-C2)-methyltransferase
MTVEGNVTRQGSRQNILGLYLDELGRLLQPLGVKSYAAKQLYGWVYAKGVFDFEGMHNLSKGLRKDLAERFSIEMPALLREVVSAEARVVKYLLSLSDGKAIECVLIGMRDKDTFCISTQVGCRFRCAFCATGRKGLMRNLTPSEILGQILFLRWAAEAPAQLPKLNSKSDRGKTGPRRHKPEHHTDPARTAGPTNPVSERAFNVVFMGMGEPLDNYDNVVKAIRIMEHPDGLAVGGKRITLSTCGLPHRIRDLAKEDLGIGLALSLNATTDEVRGRLIPAAKNYKLKEIIEALRYFAEKSGRRVTLEYVLIAGVNDGPNDAKRLASIASSIPSKINLIEVNSSPVIKLAKPSEEVVQRFVQILYPRAPAVTLRKSRGSDILAACGQLGAEALKSKRST